MMNLKAGSGELEWWRKERDAAGNSSDRREYRFSLGAPVLRFLGL